MRCTPKDGFEIALLTDRKAIQMLYCSKQRILKHRNRRLIFCGFCIIIGIGTKLDSFVNQKQNLNESDK